MREEIVKPGALAFTTTSKASNVREVKDSSVTAQGNMEAMVGRAEKFECRCFELYETVIRERTREVHA